MSVVSIASAASGATDKTICTLSSATDDFDVIMSEHADLPSAADSCREKLASGRKQARSVRRDAAALSKHMSRDRQGEQGTLPRSPARHNVKVREWGMALTLAVTFVRRLLHVFQYPWRLARC